MPGFYDTILIQYTEYLFVIPGAARANPHRWFSVCKSEHAGAWIES